MKKRYFLGGMLASLMLVFSSQAAAWKTIGEWSCCGKNPKQRVHVVCSNSGLGPKFVNVDGKWYLKKNGMPDGEGTAYPSLDAAAKSFCKE